MEFFIILTVLYTIGSAVLASTVAGNKGHSATAWFFAGLVFGVVGLLAVGLMDNAKTEDETRAYVVQRKAAWQQAQRAGKGGKPPRSDAGPRNSSSS